MLGLSRIILFLLSIGAVCAAVLSNEGHGQGWPGGTPLNKEEQTEAAAVLNALRRGWALVDNSPEVDFLVLVNEGREELDFYPKKFLIGMMEHSGLIKNPDVAGSSVRHSYIRYERDSSGWKEITEAGSVVFQYRITSKGRNFLRNAPRLIGKPLLPLRVATSPIEVPSKALKVVTYDRQATQTLLEEFERKAKAQIEALFASGNGTDRGVSSGAVLKCGPRLWQKLKSQARRNGLRPVGRLVEVTYNLKDTTSKSKSRQLGDVPMLAVGEAQLFLKTLREVFVFDEPPVVRRAEFAATQTYPYQEQTMDIDLPPPNFPGLKLTFIAEANNSKFLVLVESVPDADFKHFGPAVSWVELMDSQEQK